MAVGQGFSKVVTSGSIFHYDTGDMINSFKGKPGTNSLDGVIRNYDGYSLSTYTNGKLFETNGYTETVNIPALGNRTVESIEIYNVYSGYGTDGNYNCCPTLFRYSQTGWNGTQLSGSTLYMYEIIYKCASGYTNPNYMYHYETRADGTYNTEFGVHDDSRRISLGDGWYYAWGGFTTQATTAQGYFGCWYYNYNVRDKVSIASISLQQGNSVLPPRQFIPGATTRSNTQGLIDLTGNTTITTVNDTFDSNGGLMFDGTNTYLQLSSDVLSSSSPYTLNVVLNPADINNMANSFPWYNTYGNGFWHHVTSTGIAWRHQGQYGDMSGLNIQNGVWSMLSLTWDGSTLILYFNGTQVNSASCTAGYYNNGSARIGMLATRSSGYDYNYNGKAPVNQVYNRALTAKEIKQNYNHYKTRFNLP